MPLLKEEIILSDITKSKFNGWNESDSWSLNAVTGIYDDPENQAQLPLSVDFANGGHLAVCGSVVTGKSTFLQTLIYSLAVKYSPNVVNFTFSISAAECCRHLKNYRIRAVFCVKMMLKKSANFSV